MLNNEEGQSLDQRAHFAAIMNHEHPCVVVNTVEEMRNVSVSDEKDNV